jgi:hypothetical protein
VTIQLLVGGTQIQTATTGSDGLYSVAGLLAGEYEVREVQPSSYHYSSTPNEVTVSVPASGIVPLDFGDWNFRVQYLPLTIHDFPAPT